MAGSSPAKGTRKSALMRRWLYVLPIVVFGLMAAGFYYGLGIDSNVLPSALINEEAPQFDLPPLPGHDKGFSTADLQGHVSLVNTFASWCAPCRMEHPALNALAKTKRVPIYGIDYKDTGAAAPFVYFDIIGAYGTMHGAVEVELATRILVPRPDGSTETRFLCSARLRCWRFRWR